MSISARAETTGRVFGDLHRTIGGTEILRSRANEKATGKEGVEVGHAVAEQHAIQNEDNGNGVAERSWAYAQVVQHDFPNAGSVEDVND